MQSFLVLSHEAVLHQEGDEMVLYGRISSVVDCGCYRTFGGEFCLKGPRRTVRSRRLVPMAVVEDYLQGLRVPSVFRLRLRLVRLAGRLEVAVLPEEEERKEEPLPGGMRGGAGHQQGG